MASSGPRDVRGLHISISARARHLRLRALAGLGAPGTVDTGDPGGTFLGPRGLPRPTQDTRTECKRPQSSRDTSGMDILDWLHGIVAGEKSQGMTETVPSSHSAVLAVDFGTFDPEE
ncbi:hypothetical protein TURU_050227 [Turdus rufiventris]|nr:hypothetical protein TURU_050227 [Turdus rufiventris]